MPSHPRARVFVFVFAVFVFAGEAEPVAAAEPAPAPGDPLAGWNTMAGEELAEHRGGTALLAFGGGDSLLNSSTVAASVGAAVLTNVSAGAISQNSVMGVDGLSTIIFNSGSAVSTAVSYQLNVMLK